MEYKAEKVTPYNNTESKSGQVKQMFNSIAPAYDFMNRAMTMGIDRIWRKIAVKMVAETNPASILDVATGTGDLTLQLYDKIRPAKGIIGIDLAQGMLDVAERKINEAGLAENIKFEVGDCLKMRFPDKTFDAVTVAYGVRNFEHLEQGYTEMYRVLTDGGVLCVVELSTPTNPVLKLMYDIYTRTLIPLVGRLVSKDTRAYSYLPESIAAAPQGEAMLDIMRRAGFSDCRCRRMTFGACSIYIGRKK